MAQSEIASDKIDAYWATHYRVGHGEHAITLKIDTRSEALLRLYETSGQACGVFITAFNPYGRVQSDAANAAANVQLGETLRSTLSHVIEGAGADPAGAWPEEKSFLALGIDEDTAIALGRRFHQDAVVWMGQDAVPRLIALR